MIWNYHDDDVLKEAATIQLSIHDIPSKTVILTHYRIDQLHSNSYEVWKKMGSPQQPSQQQIAQLEKAGQLETLNPPQKLTVKDHQLNYSIELPIQGVSLLKLDWK
jgi:xylan 1,4-beta-xylosidase